jgi:hypothetical protein
MVGGTIFLAKWVGPAPPPLLLIIKLQPTMLIFKNVK